jgi:protein involved in temperature-dependent protein secretion
MNKQQAVPDSSDEPKEELHQVANVHSTGVGSAFSQPRSADHQQHVQSGGRTHDSDPETVITDNDQRVLESPAFKAHARWVHHKEDQDTAH